MLLLALLVQAILVIFISGILYGFSDFIMKALNNLSPKSAVAAMQNINVTVYRSVFMVVFILLVPVSVATAAWSVASVGWVDSIFVVAGAFLYILGVFMVTGTGNVPLNESLKRVDAAGDESDATWKRYYTRWTRLNTLRCICGVLAGISWILAVYANM